MKYFYKSKGSDFYSPKPENSPLVWILVSFALLVGSLIGLFKGYNFGGLLPEVCLVSGVVFLIVTAWQVIIAKKQLGSYKRILSYLLNYDRVQSIENRLLINRNATSFVSKSYRVLPKIWLYKEYENGFPIFYIKMEILNEEDVEKVGKVIISPALGDKYVVSSSSESRNQDWYEFICPYIGLECQWIPKTENDLEKISPYEIKLMKNVTVDMTELPHLAVYGLTGSRKTSLLMAILAEKIGCADCFFLDGKNEFSVLKKFYPSDHFAVTESEVTSLLARLIKIMKKRQKYINKVTMASDGEMQQTAKAVGLKPIYLFIDEFASIKAEFEKPKELDRLMTQALMKFRSVGIYVIFASQSPNVEGGLSGQSRSQFGTYVLLGSANQTTQRMIFEDTVTTGRTPVGEGYYLSKSANMPNAEYFIIPDLHKCKLNTLAVYERLYRRGKNHENN